MNVEHHGGIEPYSFDRRSKHWRIGEVSVLFTMVVQLAAFIWGAATLNATVNNIAALVDKLDNRVEMVDENQRAFEIEQAKLIGRTEALKEQVFKLQEDRRR